MYCPPAYECTYSTYWLLQTGVRIRTKRHGSESADPYHLITDPDPALFFIGFQDANKNIILFCFLLTVGTFTSVLTGNKLLVSHKTGEIKIFLDVFAC
jgi:hypothetical protein